MSSASNSWSDRRSLFQKGKEVHEPGSPIAERKASVGDSVAAAVRRASIGSNAGLEKTTSNVSTSDASSPTGGRRRSSNTALFGNLTNMKRGSEDYEQRRMSHNELNQRSGFVNGWYNQTFRGMQKPVPEPGQQKEQKRGVME